MRNDALCWAAGMIGLSYFSIAAYGGSATSIVGVMFFGYFAGIYGERVRTAKAKAEGREP